MTFEQIYIEYLMKITSMNKAGKISDAEAAFLLQKLNEWDAELTRKIKEGTKKEDDDE